MPRAVRVAEAGDRLGGKLDPSRWRRERVTHRVRAEPLEWPFGLCGRDRQQNFSSFPELLELGKLSAGGARVAASLGIQMLNPLAGGSTLRELSLNAEPRREVREDGVV